MTDQESPAWRLDGRSIIVTGASSGIGAAVARALSAAGASTLLVGRDAGRLDASAAQIRAAGGRCATVRADVTEDGAAQRVVAAALEQDEAIDGVVHAAGVFLFRPFAETTAEELDAQYATNVRAPFVLTRAALPHLSEGASVVLIGSNLAHLGTAGTVAYATLKAAVGGLARTLAVELGARRVRVNVVAPGVTRTPMTAPITADPGAEAQALAATALGRLGDAEDVAASVLYLSSDAARHVTGATIVIDGGESAR